MKKLLSLVMVLSLCMPVLGAGNMRKTVTACGISVTETRNTGEFTGISSCCGIKVLVYESDKCGVEIEADRNIAPYLITEVSGKTLHIGYDGNVNIKNNGSTTVKVYCSEIDDIDASSGTTVSLETVFSGDALTVHATSASYVAGTVDYGSCVLDTTSGAEIRLTGTCDKYEVSASSGSSADMRKLEGRYVTVETSSGASASVYATVDLRAEASSGSSIRYYGSPQNTNLTRSSGGSVRAR